MDGRGGTSSRPSKRRCTFNKYMYNDLSAQAAEGEKLPTSDDSVITSHISEAAFIPRQSHHSHHPQEPLAAHLLYTSINSICTRQRRAKLRGTELAKLYRR